MTNDSITLIALHVLADCVELLGGCIARYNIDGAHFGSLVGNDGVLAE